MSAGQSYFKVFYDKKHNVHVKQYLHKKYSEDTEKLLNQLEVVEECLISKNELYIKYPEVLTIHQYKDYL